MAKKRRYDWAAGLSVFLLLLSVSSGLLHWRVLNEPGASDVPALMLLHRVLLSVGVSGFIFSLVRYFRNSERSFLSLLSAIGIAVVVYLPFLGLTLLMLV